MVAAQISTRGMNDEDCQVHETTLLPSIRGFGPMMAMIFCPAMDLKRDQWNSRYISVRTGLGYNEDKNSPYYPEHDAMFALDFEFSQNDLMLVSLLDTIDSIDILQEINQPISLSLSRVRSTKSVTRSIHCCLHPMIIHNAIQCHRKIDSRPCPN